MASIQHPKALAAYDTDHLAITWQDGSVGYISWMKLREACPCAACNEDRHRITAPLAKPSSTGFSLTVLHTVPGNQQKPKSLKPLGNYAYKITWDDGHDTGIYTFEFLHSLCSWQPPAAGHA